MIKYTYLMLLIRTPFGAMPEKLKVIQSYYHDFSDCFI